MRQLMIVFVCDRCQRQHEQPTQVYRNGYSFENYYDISNEPIPPKWRVMVDSSGSIQQDVCDGCFTDARKDRR